LTEQPAASVDFRELARLLAAADQDEAAIGEVVARYDLDIDFATIPVLAERTACGSNSAQFQPRRSRRG